MTSSSPTTVTDGFHSFALCPPLLRGIADAGFSSPRPIQLAAVPQALQGRDILGLAQTGTGKTAAFALPILERLARQRTPGPAALIVAPTRELAQQIAAELSLLGRHLPVRTVTIYGGVSARPQIEALRRRPQVIVACPGRLLDLLGQGYVQLERITTLVLDEADHMFDMGFLPDIRRILAALPARRQNLLFSATMPGEIRSLADEVLRAPHVVELASTAPADTIEHALYAVEEPAKLPSLGRLLSGPDFVSAIVFCRTKHRAKRLALKLSQSGHRAIALQGNMSQSQRDRAMDGFRQRAFDVLVATDIAARGIDVAKVSHVINYDVPNTPDAYTHRIGRTGRAELFGKAYTFVTTEDRAMVRTIERWIGFPLPRRRLEGSDSLVEQVSEPLELSSYRHDRGRGRSGASQRRAATAPRHRAEQPAHSRGGGAGRREPQRVEPGATSAPRRTRSRGRIVHSA